MYEGEGTGKDERVKRMKPEKIRGGRIAEGDAVLSPSRAHFDFALFLRPATQAIKMLEVYRLSIVRYTIAIGIEVSYSPSIHRHRSINIAIHRLFDVLSQPYTLPA